MNILVIAENGVISTNISEEVGNFKKMDKLIAKSFNSWSDKDYDKMMALVENLDRVLWSQVKDELGDSQVCDVWFENGVSYFKYL